MTSTATETTGTATTKAAKPPVLDSKDQPLELGMRVVLLSDDNVLGTITGLEYQRGRAVIKVDDKEKLAVRPAAKLRIKKSKSGKIERVERAVRAGRKSTKDTAAPAPADA